MTRIGTIRCFWTQDFSHPWFRLVIEGGQVTLGCWRLVELEQADPVTFARRSVFKRIS